MAQLRPTTEVGVANLALGKCKEDQIAAFADDTHRARVAGRHFGLVRDSLLARLDWNFATTWAAVTVDAVAGVGDYTLRYALPVGTIMVREVAGLVDDEWAVEVGDIGGTDKKILVTSATVELVRVTQLVDDPTLWDPLFMQAFVCLLAAAMAPELGRSRSQAESYIGEAEELLVPLAKRVDSKEKAPSKVGAQKVPSWIAARAGWRRARAW